MRWSDCAVQDLKKYASMGASIGNMAERVEALTERATSINSTITDGIPTRGGAAHDDFLLDNMAERERITLNMEAVKKLLTVIDRGLDALNKTERRVLELFFICRVKDHVTKLSEELHIEQAQVYRIKDQALRKFTVYMYGIEEY